jgi:hypothetical protein
MLARELMRDLGERWRMYLEVDVWMAYWGEEPDYWWLYWVGWRDFDVEFP